MLTQLEIAAGVPLPQASAPLPVPPTSLEPGEALERSVLRALLRPPCLVSFSGGCDSSLVLAATATLARRAGLALPVPVTMRSRGEDAAEERDWQETVIAHLGLEEWERIDVGDELECIGPIAQEVLLRHGVLWPANAHFHVLQLRLAAGGSLLTGIGGDELFSRSGWARLHRVLGARTVPRPRDVLHLGAALAPAAVRRRIITAMSEVELQWLRPAAQQAVLQALAREGAAEPLSWRKRFGWLLGARYLRLGIQSLSLLAHDYDVELHHPLLDPVLAGSLAALPRGRRFEDRPGALTSLFGDLLPAAVASRRSKASFADTLWGPASRAFAEAWSGEGVDPEIVDVDGLRRRWRVERAAGPHTLLQALWLARSRQAPSVSRRRSSVSDIAPHECGRRSSQADKALS
jgi:asparagine synthase (glutamine-hydrolysing)